jgi:hypothetical protein
MTLKINPSTQKKREGRSNFMKEFAKSSLIVATVMSLSLEQLTRTLPTLSTTRMSSTTNFENKAPTSFLEHGKETPHDITITPEIKQVVNVTNNPPRLYYCENPNSNEVGLMLDLMSSVLPEYILSDSRWLSDNTEEVGNGYDVFLLSIGRHHCNPSHVANWRLHQYHGKVLKWSPESAKVAQTFRDMEYELGPVYESDDSGKSDWHTMRLYHLQIIFWSFYMKRKDPRFHYERSGDFLLDHTKKTKNTGKHFLVYGQSNCQPHRDEAFIKLSEIDIVHSAGRCGDTTSPNRVKVASGVSLGNWGDNALINKEYRFCLTMEHGLQEGYITEKILLAFFAGCIPIYWGPTSIFDLFSGDSFIYYNVSNPQPALDRIQYLEANKTAYLEMLNGAPILRNGTATIEKYFSFSDDIGGGKLKQRIRSFLELDQFHFEGKIAPITF